VGESVCCPPRGPIDRLCGVCVCQWRCEGHPIRQRYFLLIARREIGRYWEERIEGGIEGGTFEGFEMSQGREREQQIGDDLGRMDGSGYSELERGVVRSYVKITSDEKLVI
jgi:hypothetical protein